ncbi:MAG: permease, partial [Lentisphaeria bacterium]
MRTDWKTEWQPLAWMAAIFAACYFLPVGQTRFEQALHEALELVKWYAREHVLLCLVPAFFIAGGIGVFVSQAGVMKYLGPKASKPLAYGVASVSGTILAVCSCTVLPLFAGIWKRGAGLGPACAFLYSGPAISVLSIILTARILGLEIGVARAVGAIVFSLLIGFLMYLIFRREETAKAAAAHNLPEPAATRPLWQTVLFFAAMTGILVFANWGKPVTETGTWHAIWAMKWWITAGFGLLLGVTLVRWYGMGAAKILVLAAATAAAAWRWPQEPVAAFSVGSLGLAFLLSREDGEAGDWFAASWG